MYVIVYVLTEAYKIAFTSVVNHKVHRYGTKNVHNTCSIQLFFVYYYYFWGGGEFNLSE